MQITNSLSHDEASLICVFTYVNQVTHYLKTQPLFSDQKYTTQ